MCPIKSSGNLTVPIKTPTSAYDNREVRDAILCERLGVILTPEMSAERRHNYEMMMTKPGMLHDIDDLDTVTVGLCGKCGKPIIITLHGNDKRSTIWLDCCGNGSLASHQTIDVRSFSAY